MKKYILAVLIMFAIINVLVVNAEQYSQPYGSSDEIPMEATDIESTDLESINEVNNDVDSPDIENEEIPIEQENEISIEDSDGATAYEQQ